MTLENKSWKEALDFLADFSNHYKIESIAERKKQFQTKEENARSGIKIRYSGTPNNEKLLAYFEGRGISKETLQANTKQIHYENNGKKYFGIGMENISGGFEIRNPLAKIKIGRNDISEIKGIKNEMIIFEGMSDMFSFLELQKLSGNSNTRTLVSLNSITNVERFVSLHKDFEGKLFLCLDGDKGGDLATEKLLQEFSGKNIKDVRSFYAISEHGNNDLNDYLKNKLGIQIEQKSLLLITKIQVTIMETIHLDSKEFPILSQLEETHLNQTLDNLTEQANPGKQLTQADKNWSALMLEMDLAAQSGSIQQPENLEEDPQTTRNRMMLKKARENNIPWAEDY